MDKLILTSANLDALNKSVEQVIHNSRNKSNFCILGYRYIVVVLPAL